MLIRAILTITPCYARFLSLNICVWDFRVWDQFENKDWIYCLPDGMTEEVGRRGGGAVGDGDLLIGVDGT